MNRPKISGYSRVETAKKMVDSLAFQDLRVHFCILRRPAAAGAVANGS